MDNMINQVLERARWAPSGDNCQPWRFEILDPVYLRVHISYDPSNIYDGHDGKLAWVSAGCLLENIKLAAAELGHDIQLLHVTPFVDGKAKMDIEFFEGHKKNSHQSLEKYIEKRTVTRTRYKSQNLSEDILQDLEKSVGGNFKLVWNHGLKEKLSMTRINMLSTNIRLRSKEAFDIHRSIIDWDKSFSSDKIPSIALGFSKISLAITKWALKDWSRVDIMNRFFCGTFLPKLELDLLPGLLCAGHFSLFFKEKKAIYSEHDLLEAGSAIQRLWLTAAKYDLGFQPSMAPLIFANYAKNKIPFTTNRIALNKSQRLLDLMSSKNGTERDSQIFQGRIGYLPHNYVATGRSTRKSILELSN